MSTTTFQQVKSSENFSFGTAVADLTSSHCFSEIHILAVDDSLIDRKLVEKLLKVASYKVTTADTALRALEVLGISDDLSRTATNAIQVNLILTDYCMPGMTGYDLLRRVKETSTLKEIPVVIMSAEDIPDRITKCLADGAEEFILKPLRLADVKRLKGHIRHKEPTTNDHELKYAFDSGSLYCNAAEAQCKVSCDFVDISVVTASVKRRNTSGVYESSQCPQKHVRLSDDSND